MNSDRWAPAAYTAAAVIEIARMADVVRAVDPRTAVPTCPGWSVAELVEHTGTVHRWATQMVGDLATERLDPSTLDLGLPDDRRASADWLAAGAAPMTAVFGAADPDAPMWVWGADQHARFWMRRMLHETSVHRADIEIASGVRPHRETDIAVDAIDELLDNLPTASYFRPRVDELRGQGESIALRALDSDDSWLINLDKDQFRWERARARDIGEATVSVAATTDALTLLLYRRAAPGDDGYDVTGNEQVLARWLECSAL